MSTILVLNLPAQGHINPTLPVVAELVRRGERVIYYSSEDFRAAIEHTGAIYRSYGTTTAPLDLSRPVENGFKVFVQLLQISELVLEQLLPEMAADKPDAIIYDQLCMWGQYVAQILHVPAICSMTMFVISFRMLLHSPHLLLQRLTSQKEEREMVALAAAISAKYSVKKLDLLSIANNPGQLNIVFTSTFFQPYASTLNTAYRFVGPAIAPRPDAPAFPFDALQADKPLLYISLGTIYNQNTSFYRLCFDAFASSPYQVVLAVGRRTTIDQLGTLPENFLVQNVVPQLEILQRAVLFITHGGMNSASEALYYDVPLIVIPQATDQPWVAKRVAQLGAGRALQREHVTPSLLRSTAERVLTTPSFAQASATIGATLRQAGGYFRATDEIQQFLHAHQQADV